MFTITIKVQTCQGRTNCYIKGDGQPANLVEHIMFEAFHVGHTAIVKKFEQAAVDSGLAKTTKTATGEQAKAAAANFEQDVKDSKSTGKN